MYIRYENHYNKLIEEFDKEEGEKIYKKFLRSSSLETYIIKFGKEKGEKKYKEKKKPGVSLNKMIDKYGKEEGEKKYKKWKKLILQNEESFIKRYGENIGKKKYKEFKLKCVIKDSIKNNKNSKYNNRHFNTKIDFYLDKNGGDYEKSKKELSNRQSTTTLSKLITKYGKKEGEKKYIIYNKKKSLSLERFISLYGEIEGSEKWDNYLNKLKYSHSINYYIDKYGEKNGKYKWVEINKKKLNKFNGRSKISDEFCYKLFNNLKKLINENENVYFSENEYIFFVNKSDFKFIMPDYYIKKYNIIIEFYGDYWHRNPKIYNDEISEKIRIKDNNRIEILKELGNKVIIIWENDYRKDKQKTINKIYNNIKKIIENNGND